MRNYHRWLSVIFGVFLLWISVTGIASHVSELIANGGFEAAEPAARPGPANAVVPAANAHEPAHAAAVTSAQAAFICPPDMTCKPKPPPQSARAWVSYFHHLHSGEEFGPVGTIISLLSGVALLFFAFSGLWMYVRMWANRKSRGLGGTFWK